VQLAPELPPPPPDLLAHPAAPDAPRRKSGLQLLLTGVIVLGPLAAIACVAIAALNGQMPSLASVGIALAFYVITALGVTVGYHRLFTHRSFVARRPLKISLALAGAMSMQGSIIGWVAAHRRHHMFSDRAGDPHSPVRPASQHFGRVRGLLHAHLGWLFREEDTSKERFAPELLADRDIRIIDRLVLPLNIATFALPFAFGYLLSGTLGGAFAALLWAGVVRVACLHHVTWSTNSLCHVFGRRPFRTTDASTNFAPLALLSMGESWHNAHHAFPSLARHGVDRRQLDVSAELIRLFERLGWATRVRWPDRGRLDERRVAC
jgi:stearoyl-CoA desaturase (delta-9 desaturase)